MRVVLAFLIGAVLGWVGAFATYVAFTALTGFVDREGAVAMAVAFLIGPVVAVAAGLTLAIVTVARRRGHRAGTPAP